LKEQALVRTRWRIRFGSSYEPVAGQATELWWLCSTPNRVLLWTIILLGCYDL